MSLAEIALSVAGSMALVTLVAAGIAVGIQVIA